MSNRERGVVGVLKGRGFPAVPFALPGKAVENSFPATRSHLKYRTATISAIAVTSTAHRGCSGKVSFAISDHSSHRTKPVRMTLSIRICRFLYGCWEQH